MSNILTRSILRPALLAMATLCLPGMASAQNARDALPYGPKVGAAVGQKLIGLRDDKGSAQTFGMLTGKRGLILIFSRSLSW